MLGGSIGFDYLYVLNFCLLTVQAKRPNEVVIRKIADNRREQEQVVQNFIQPCSAQLCESAAYIESIIT